MPIQKHIYIVDDDTNGYYKFSDILKEIDSSIQLTRFNTYSEVLHCMKAGNGSPDLIILLTNMGENASQACLLSLRKNRLLSHIPIIINKPAEVEELKNTVSAMLALLK